MLMDVMIELVSRFRVAYKKKEEGRWQLWRRDGWSMKIDIDIFVCELSVEYSVHLLNNESGNFLQRNFEFSFVS